MAIRIMVTGVGGGVGQSVLKALEGTGYETIGVDSEPLAAGLYAAARGYLGKNARDPGFVDRLIEIGLREECRLLFPGHDVELGPISENRDRFEDAGIEAVVSDERVVSISDDKLATAQFLAACGLPAPKTDVDLSAIPEAFPVVLKPRVGGARSRDTYLARDRGEFERYRAFVDQANCVVQEHIEGDEYTCGAVYLDGECYGPIVMRRILRAGDTYKAFVEDNAVVAEAVRTATTELKPFGACNFQLRVRDGVPYIFEINARCSGTTAARALSGFNEPRMVADFVIHGTRPGYAITKQTILRYWKEMVVSNDQVERLRETGAIAAKLGPL